MQIREYFQVGYEDTVILKVIMVWILADNWNLDIYYNEEV
jgi:hypothetical protein